MKENEGGWGNSEGGGVGWGRGGYRSVVSPLLSRLWLNLVPVWPKKSAGGNFRDCGWISLELFTPSQCLRRGRESERGDQRNRTEWADTEKTQACWLFVLTVHTLSYIWMCSPTLRVVWSVYLMRMRKRPVLGGNSGLVSSTMLQEADRSCAEMCQRRPSGTSTTKKTQGIKINLGQHGRASAETGNIPLRERQQVRHGGRPLDC